MTKYNHKNTLLERGGLMIEALAMLGLIAVVTPTMYKKSAERTLEVEDINTATTMRTYMNAAESFMNANRAAIIKQMDEATSDDEKVIYPVEDTKLTSFLPYGFANSGLYDYGKPKVVITRQKTTDGYGTKLTAVTIFPSREGNSDDGIGQERTTRITSLVGANGGYVRQGNVAKGVGGLWTIESAELAKLFPGVDTKEYSVVGVSLDEGGNGIGDMDNTKYLQRTAEDPDPNNKDELWRNTMRTDLYMGGYDVTKNDEDADQDSKRHSIRNIESLIVGTDSLQEGYGLYIAEDRASQGNNPEFDRSGAFIGGTLKAAKASFSVTYNKSSNESELSHYVNNDTYCAGSKNAIYFKSSPAGFEQQGDLNIAKDFGTAGGSTTISIGGGDFYGLKANISTDGKEKTLNLLKNNMFTMQINDKYSGDEYQGSTDTITMMNGGTKTIASGTPTIDASYTNTNNIPQTPVTVDSNMRVNGTLIAQQLDTPLIRATAISAGSKYINDEHQWLNVDENGVKITSTDIDSADPTKKDPNVQLTVDNEGSGVNSGNIKMYIGKQYTTPTDPGTPKELYYSTGVEMNTAGIVARADKIELHNDQIYQELNEKEINIGKEDNYSEDYRVVLNDGGNLDLENSNLHVTQKFGNDTNQRSYNILSVGSDTKSKYEGGDNLTIDTYSGGSQPYDLVAQGNILFAGAPFDGTSGSPTNVKYHELLSMGGNGSDTAAVNIVGYPDKISTGNVLYVSSNKGGNIYNDKTLSGSGYYEFDEDGRYRKPITPGTIYIRKGSLASLPNRPGASTEGGSAREGTGIIEASRFVANNLDANGNLVTVPELVKPGVLKMYYEQKDGSIDPDDRVAYDTYMVNPAYTSVMHDIKLTTRGGARLSDILPDFITKGIYIASNDKKEHSGGLTFKFASTSGDKNNIKKVQYGSETDEGTDDGFASPYMGSVPTPQCPPGYARVVTVTPGGFQMTQAGQLKFDNESNRKQYLVNDMPNEELLDVLDGYSNIDNLIANQPATKAENFQVIVNANEDDTTHTFPFSVSLDENSNTGHGHVFGKGTYQVKNSSGAPTYVVASNKDGWQPFVFQQNTWLKSLAVPLCSEKKVVLGSTDNNEKCESSNYVRGWAIVSGYVYPTNKYSDFVSEGSNVNKANDNKSAGGFYWNLFPVEKDTIESYVTTYCYFNRGDISFGLGNPVGDTTMYDLYHPINSPVPTDYKKASDSNYLKRLDDPTLKYKDAW